MTIDESLLASFNGEPLLRLYSWEENSFTLGRFQTIDTIPSAKRFGNNFAKRPTGGGLLLHGYDLSYTIIISPEFIGTRSVKESYEYLCTFILIFYKKLGLNVAYAKDLMNITLCKSQFCQEGFEPYDILYEGKKLGGNAQKHTKKFILQHGSIPLRNDEREFSGHSLEEFGIKLSEEEAKGLIRESFTQTYNAIFKKEAL